MKQTSTPASTKLVISACDPFIDLRLPSLWWVSSMMILNQSNVTRDAAHRARPPSNVHLTSAYRSDLSVAVIAAAVCWSPTYILAA